jgi:hypothetical protein
MIRMTFVPRFFRAVRVGDDQNYRISDETERLPTRLAGDDSVLHGQLQRIVEHQSGGLETDPVLGAVESVLVLIPFESHIQSVVAYL